MDELPSEIGDYKLRLFSIDQLCHMEYTKTQRFLVGRKAKENFDPNDVLIEAIVFQNEKINGGELCEKAKNDLLLQLNVRKFVQWEFRNTLGQWFIPELVMKWSDEQDKIVKLIQFACLYNFNENYFHLVAISSNLARDQEVILQGIDKVINLIASNPYDIKYHNFNISNLTFTNALFIYTNNINTDLEELKNKFDKKGIKKLVIRDKKYREIIMKIRKPDFFICHDSRDKDKAARPLYEALTKNGYYVWLDETELFIGDSLTTKIAKGIKEAKYGIVIISKDFLKNDKWAEHELRSFLTKEVSSGKTIILPIWYGISEEDLKEKSYYLLDKKAGKIEDGIENIALQLIQRFESET